jgi:hypothetical protein
MMIGLLQSGTGIGRGMCPAIFSNGLLEARDVARGRGATVRAGRGETCLKPAGAMPPLEEEPVTGALPRAGDRRCAPVVRLRAERRGRVDARDGCPLPPKICGVEALAGDAGAGLTAEEAALVLLGVPVACSGRDTPGVAAALPALCATPWEAPLDAEPSVNGFPEDPSPREDECRWCEPVSEESSPPGEEDPSWEPRPWEPVSEPSPPGEEDPSLEPRPWEPVSEPSPPGEEDPSLEPRPWEPVSGEPSPRAEEDPSWERPLCEALSEVPSLLEKRPSCEPPTWEPVSEAPPLAGERLSCERPACEAR